MTAEPLSIPLSVLLRLIEARYPKWGGFADPRFVKEALSHKQAALARAHEWLSADGADGLGALHRASQHDEILERIKKLASATNWLYLTVPKTGDLDLLHQGISKAELCAALIDLLHGPGASPERLSRFFDFVASVGASPKWTFSTYLLLLAHPQTEVFVKPTVMKTFLALIGQPSVWSDMPSGATYAHLLQLCTELKTQLALYGAADMLDVHGFIWAVTNQSERKTKLSMSKVAVREPAPQYTVTPAPPPSTQSNNTNTTYPLAQCATETGLDEATLTAWLSAIQRKRQAIVYGPPGTGKTFTAQKLALHVAGGDEARVEVVQFHPAYAYEDFIQGMRPKARANGGLDYPVVDGRFVQFCKAARAQTGACVLVIDEINRANVSRVFGELMFLLEYRDQAITLASGERFSIPRNVIVLGTMNTADRSIALVDYALRRRFAFLPLRPNYELLRRFHADTMMPIKAMDELIRTLQQINTHIGDANYALGPSFFLVSDLETQLPSIWQTEIEPYLEEYFFDKPDVVDQFRWEAVRVAMGNSA
jgi:MoxR-like ATPase